MYCIPVLSYAKCGCEVVHKLNLSLAHCVANVSYRLSYFACYHATPHVGCVHTPLVSCLFCELLHVRYEGNLVEEPQSDYLTAASVYIEVHKAQLFTSLVYSHIGEYPCD